MQIVVLQPGYIPWLGFFDQMRRCDLFIVYDDVQYTRRDWRSRNRIKSRNGSLWLTVPVLNRGKATQLIHEARIDYSHNWVRKHLGSISASYASAPFFPVLFPQLQAILEKRHQLLLELDMDLIMLIRRWLRIEVPLEYSSKLGVGGSRSERLLRICKHVGASRYLTGDAAKDYLEVEKFKAAGIEVIYHGYRHPVYKQLHGEFIPYLSVIDLLMNHGTEGAAILAGEQTTEVTD